MALGMPAFDRMQSIICNIVYHLSMHARLYRLFIGPEGAVKTLSSVGLLSFSFFILGLNCVRNVSCCPRESFFENEQF
jgi:hypothetical protein